MEEAALDPPLQEGCGENGEKAADPRRAPRFTLLIRAAKLVCDDGEFVCILRDVSENGASVKLFHKLPKSETFELHLPSGSTYELRKVWNKDDKAGFEFSKPVDVDELVNEAGKNSRHGIRVDVSFPITITTLYGRTVAVVENLSQQGARFECENKFAIQQHLRIKSALKGPFFREVQAKVRWRGDDQYGVVLDDTLSLEDFAHFAAHLQCPELLKKY